MMENKKRGRPRKYPVCIREDCTTSVPQWGVKYAEAGMCKKCFDAAAAAGAKPPKRAKVSSTQEEDATDSFGLPVLMPPSHSHTPLVLPLSNDALQASDIVSGIEHSVLALDPAANPRPRQPFVYFKPVMQHNNIQLQKHQMTSKLLGYGLDYLQTASTLRDAAVERLANYCMGVSTSSSAQPRALNYPIAGVSDADMCASLILVRWARRLRRSRTMLFFADFIEANVAAAKAIPVQQWQARDNAIKCVKAANKRFANAVDMNSKSTPPAAEGQAGGGPAFPPSPEKRWQDPAFFNQAGFNASTGRTSRGPPNHPIEQSMVPNMMLSTEESAYALNQKLFENEFDDNALQDKLCQYPYTQHYRSTNEKTQLTETELKPNPFNGLFDNALTKKTTGHPRTNIWIAPLKALLQELNAQYKQTANGNTKISWVYLYPTFASLGLPTPVARFDAALHVQDTCVSISCAALTGIALSCVEKNAKFCTVTKKPKAAYVTEPKENVYAIASCRPREVFLKLTVAGTQAALKALHDSLEANYVFVTFYDEPPSISKRFYLGGAPTLATVM